MNSLARHLRASSVSSLLRTYGGIQWASRVSSQSNVASGWNLEQQGPFPKVSGMNSSSASTGENSFSAPNTPSFQRSPFPRVSGMSSGSANRGENNFSAHNSPGFQSSPFPRVSGMSSGSAITEENNLSASNATSFQSSNVPLRDNSMWGNFRSMDFVRGTLEKDGRNTSVGSSHFSHPIIETNADVVHVKMLRNNTFVTVTDSKGKVKCKASSGCLSELKGGPKLSRYAAEATAEHIGRLAKTMGLRSVVVKVNGFIHFKKKRQAIEAFREGFSGSRSDQNPIVYIEDTTRRAHNGCRLPRKRRS